MFDTVQQIIKAAIDLCFPPSCLFCSKKLDHDIIRFCEECYDQLIFVKNPLCTCCGRFFDSGENHYCSLCLRKQFFFTKARALLIYNDQVATIIHSLKYKGRRESLATFAALKKKHPTWIFLILILLRQFLFIPGGYGSVVLIRLCY